MKIRNDKTSIILYLYLNIIKIYNLFYLNEFSYIAIYFILYISISIYS